jgi:hypothetical protein
VSTPGIGPRRLHSPLNRHSWRRRGGKFTCGASPCAVSGPCPGTGRQPGTAPERDEARRQAAPRTKKQLATLDVAREPSITRDFTPAQQAAWETEYNATTRAMPWAPPAKRAAMANASRVLSERGFVAKEDKRKLDEAWRTTSLKEAQWARRGREIQ